MSKVASAPITGGIQPCSWGCSSRDGVLLSCLQIEKRRAGELSVCPLLTCRCFFEPEKELGHHGKPFVGFYS